MDDFFELGVRGVGLACGAARAAAAEAGDPPRLSAFGKRLVRCSRWES